MSENLLFKERTNPGTDSQTLIISLLLPSYKYGEQEILLTLFFNYLSQDKGGGETQPSQTVQSREGK